MRFKTIVRFGLSKLYDEMYPALEAGASKAAELVDSEVQWKVQQNLVGRRNWVDGAMRRVISIRKIQARGARVATVDYVSRSRHNWRSLLERRVHWSSVTVTQPDGHHWQITI